MWSNSRLTAAALFVFVLCLNGSWRLRTVNAGDVDISTTIPCNGVVPAPQNTRTCYETEVDDICNPGSCDATLVPSRGKNLNFRFSPPQTKLKSPGGRNYRNGHLCRYSVTCPEDNMLMYYDWISGHFDFEPPHEFFGCLDYILITSGLNAPLLTCGNQGAFSDETGSGLAVEFRSNTVDNFPGLQMDVLCISPFSDEDGGAVSKRSAGYRRPQCRELPDPQGSSRTNLNGTAVYSWPPTSHRLIRVPRDSALRYQRNVIRISHRGVLVTYRHIKKLIFYTPFSRVRIFRGQAPSDALYGGGVLKIYRHYAYYSTSRIPPEFEPNNAERRVIGILLNATEPFFQDQLQDGGDIDLPNDTTPSPTRLPKPYRGPRSSKYTYKTYYHKYYGRIDSRIDLQAFKLATQFDNACNIFLRGAAQSFLSALDELKIRPKYYRG